MSRGRSVRALLIALTFAMIGSSSVAGQHAAAPAFMLGDFIDDYGIVYSVSEGQWLQGTASRYDIVEWNVEEQHFVARNHPENPGEAGLWTRVDWVELDASSDLAWAYCYAVYDAASHDEALSAPRSAREAPRTGCNGFPFSRMRREPTTF